MEKQRDGLNEPAPATDERVSAPETAPVTAQVQEEGTPEPPVTLKELYGELLTPLNLFLVAVAGLLGLTGLLGGWNRLGEKEEKLTAVTTGQVMRAAPFEVKFRKAYWYVKVEGLPLTDPGSRALLVTADVTNTSKRPLHVATLQKAFRLTTPGLTSFGKVTPSDEAQPQAYRASDLLDLRAIQPGLPTRVMLVWFQDETRPLPRAVTVQGYKQEYRKSSLSGEFAYFDATPAAETTLALKEFRLP